MEELWRDIPGYEGAYQASSLGNIKSFVRCKDGKLLTPRVNKDGYEVVNIKGKSISVHTLIALTFIGVRPDRMDTRHLDGNPRNNTADNLAYGTRKQNILDVYKQGKEWKTFDMKTVKRIKRILDTKLLTIAEIARAFQVTPRTIANIREGRTFDWEK